MNRIASRRPVITAGNRPTRPVPDPETVQTVGVKRLLAVAGLALILAGCGSSLPERDPEAVGTADAVATEGDTTSVSFVTAPGYEYFEDTTFVLGPEVAVGGAVDSAADILAGDAISVWTGACAESFPVQCQVEAVEVRRGA